MKRKRNHCAPYAMCKHCNHEVQVNRKGNIKRHDNDGVLIPFYRLNPELLCFGSFNIISQEIDIIDADLFITL